MTYARPHFSVAQLAAYALAGRRDADEYRDVRLHLLRGCVPCAATVRRYETGRPSQALARRRSVPSFWHRPTRGAAVCGVRAAPSASDSLVYEAGNFTLDMTIREVSRRQTVEFDGQVTRAGPGHEPVADLQLAILDANLHSPVARTSTDAFGEFGMAAGRVGPYGLRLGAGDDAPCVLVWQADDGASVIAG